MGEADDGSPNRPAEDQVGHIVAVERVERVAANNLVGSPLNHVLRRKLRNLLQPGQRD